MSSADWALGSVINLQSGPPFTVTTQINNTYAFSAGNPRADVLRNPALPAGQRTLDRWFDTSAFAQPADYRFANRGMIILHGDGLVNFDFSLMKNFGFGEGRRVQFRAESFNALNHPTFGIPGRVFGAAGFGVVSSASNARIVQPGLRLVF
ncbi:MAG TPA: hypothetical protein VFL57_18980 [Bryobacteraceae bacterium]|nr:hypothetical protein [Bryobacteraceae bacterium]